MPSKFKEIQTSVKDYFIDHPQTRRWTKWVGIFFVEIISAFAFAYGFKAFTSPNSNCVEQWYVTDKSIPFSDIQDPVRLISGGASGVSQALVRGIAIFNNVASYESMLVSIFYFTLNIPIFLLCFFKVSKQFAVFTFINVGLSSLFNLILPDAWIYNVLNIYNDLLARALFAGICTGFSSGIAALVGTSTGGYDCIAIYISEKKSTSVGKYSLFFNSITVFAYVLFSVIGHSVNPSYNTQNPSKIISTALYTVVYFFVSSQVFDLLNTKNKKQELQIFTSNNQIPKILIHTFPHSCTVVDSYGAFSGNKNYVVYMVVSKSESKKAIKMIHNVDEHAFVSVIDINQVYGKFYIKPYD